MTTRSALSRPARRVAAACLLAVATLLAAPGPAEAWTEGACPDGAGVTVVVDFAGFRDEVVVRCAPSAASGYEALEQVGLSYTPTARFPGFLCRIEGYPAEDPCQNTPPPDAYWGYWRAEHGGSWAYNHYGPATTSPPPGPVEGWRFSTGDAAPPRVAPPGEPSPGPEPEPEPSPEPEPEPTPEPEQPAPTTPAPAAPTTTSPPPPESSTPTDGAGAADAAAPTEEDQAPSPEATRSPTVWAPRTEDPAPGMTATPAEPTTTATEDAPTEDAPPPGDAPMDAASAPREDAGPPLATLLGVGLVAIVGGAAVLVDRRRRQS